jgi:hypothetical protein
MLRVLEARSAAVLVRTPDGFSLDDLPESYAYIAYLEGDVILLEMQR